MTSNLTKNREKQHAKWVIVYTGVLVDLAYLKKKTLESVFLVVSFMRKKRHFQPRVKQWWKFKLMAPHSTWKEIKIQLNFALWFINWMPNQAHRQKKKNAGRFRLPPKPNDALQNYSILWPGYRSVSFLDTKCTVGILKTYFHSICAQ